MSVPLEALEKMGLRERLEASALRASPAPREPLVLTVRPDPLARPAPRVAAATEALTAQQARKAIQALRAAQEPRD